MIIKIDFGNENIQFISCTTKVGRRIHKFEDEMLDWFHDDNKNKKYWSAEERGEGRIPDFAAFEIVEWLNNVKFKKGIAKAKVIENRSRVPQKTWYL